MSRIADEIMREYKIKEAYKKKTRQKCTEKDWIKFLNKKKERNKNMFKVIAKQNYTDKRPELIEEYNKGEEVKYNNEGNAIIKQNDIYLINDITRAKEIQESGLAEVKEIKEEVIETAKKKVKAETAVKKTRKKSK